MVMKKIFFIIVAVLTVVSVRAQYVFENADFENWEDVSYTSASGTTYNGIEPTGWNSYLSGTGSVKAVLVAHCPGLVKGEARPGSAGVTSVLIKAQNFLVKNFAGNLTSGCIEMGNLDQSQTGVNYNYTNTEVAGQAMRFVGRPDAMKVWARFKGANKGQISVYLHSDGRYQFPVATGGQVTATMVGSASQFVGSDDTWAEYTVPFSYVSTDCPAYALVSFTTSNIPGEGKTGDYMYIDDISLVYNSELSEIKYDGRSILGQTSVDAVYNESRLTDVKSNGAGATVTRVFDSETNVLTVTVTAQDNSSSHVYTYQFKAPEPVYNYYNIVFLDYDQSEIASMTIKEGDEVVAPSAPEREGYIFDGWDPDVVSPAVSDAVYTATYRLAHTWPVSGTEKSYSDKLTVTINGDTSDPQVGKVTVTYKDNGVIDFSMKDFILVSNGDEIPVGNIDIKDIAQTWDSYNKCGIFTFNGNITIPAGSDPEKFWMGPYLGAIPLQMSGKMSDERLHVSIFINLMSTMGQMVAVEFGEDFGKDVPVITYSLKQNSITYTPSEIPWDATQVTMKYSIIEHSSDETVADKEISRSYIIKWAATEDEVRKSGVYTDTKYNVDVPYSILKHAKPAWILPTSGTRVYTEDLYVGVGDNISGPMDCQITITFHDNNTIDLALYNFILQTGEDKLYVGNIVINDVPLNDTGHHYSTFEYSGDLTIAAGTEPADVFWLGPTLGELPLPTAGKIDNEKLYVTIQLTAAGQKIDVKLGNLAHFTELDNQEFTGIDSVVGSKAQISGSAPAYDLQGRRVSMSSRGLKIVNGRLIVR